ncbi:signal peptidase I [Clostridium cylindrosporum]|uniref:Signal peptidase I n=1 Tax=Clostridium cylindrosporum DSM 605 TaxID=1121307 RepID=A0A0J8D9F7_CLOCY|nr:signal peptidase I [Clostridium cylindrosporum]KMT22487.1 signal peptidase I [Clostridium cylindrosporum DSM 605]
MVNRKNLMKEIMSWVLSILIAFFISILLNSKVVAKVRVKQSSMENTLKANQQLIIDKLSYNFTSPKRGDIIIFLENQHKRSIIDDAMIFIKDLGNKGDNNSRLVKRVIGVPGDKIDIKDGHVYVNGEKILENYVKGETFSQDLKFPIKVENDKLFVLGDNRPVSLDSRAFGPIDYDQVEGKAVFRVYPFDKLGNIK